MNKKYLALDFGNDSRLLDHLAPLCHLFGMPLLVCNEKNYALMKKYYPQIQTLYESPEKISYEKLSFEYDVFFQSLFFRENLFDFFGKLQGKKNRFVFCPHGNSDKGYISPLLSPIIHQDIVFYYGEQMKKRLMNQNLWEKISHKMRIGNTRYFFYLAHKDFYDAVIKEEIFSKLDPSKKTILYAPTWEDGEKTSSFFRFGKKIAEELSGNFNLIIKPHPLLEELDIGRYHQTMGYFQSKKNIYILEDYPLIYPLLSCVDIYLGDFSSVGYDFLAFQRPMFFFVSKSVDKKKVFSFPLLMAGLQVNESKNLFSFIEENLPQAKLLASHQKKLYEEAFGPSLSSEEVRKNFSQILLQGKENFSL